MGLLNKQVRMLDDIVKSQKRKKPIVYAPSRLISGNQVGAINSWGSNTAKNSIVAVPAIKNDGQNTDTTR